MKAAKAAGCFRTSCIIGLVQLRDCWDEGLCVGSSGTSRLDLRSLKILNPCRPVQYVYVALGLVALEHVGPRHASIRHVLRRPSMSAWQDDLTVTCESPWSCVAPRES